MRTPYVVGDFARNGNFYGRGELLNEFLNTHHRCICLLGNRRIGKTSLLRRLEKESSDVALYLNLQRAPNGDLKRMVRALEREIGRKVGQHPALNSIRFGKKKDICEAIEIIADTAEKLGFNILMLWDEAEVLLDLNDDYLQCLRSALQDHERIRTIITGTNRLNELYNRGTRWATSSFLLGFHIEYMPIFSNSEAEDLVCQVNNPEGRIQVDPELMDEILATTGKHPFLIQHLCSLLFQPEGRLRPINDSDLVVTGQLASFFLNDYNNLSDIERKIVGRIAQKGHCTASELHLLLEFHSEKANWHLNTLEKLGMVFREGDNYRIANAFFRKWLEAEGYGKDLERNIQRDTENNIKSKIRGLVAKGEIREAVRLAREESEKRQDSERRDEITLLSSQYEKVTKEWKNGRIHINDYNMQINRIEEGLLDLIEKME